MIIMRIQIDRQILATDHYSLKTEHYLLACVKDSQDSPNRYRQRQTTFAIQDYC